MPHEVSFNSYEVELKFGPHHLKVIEVDAPCPTRLTFARPPEGLDADWPHWYDSEIKRVPNEPEHAVYDQVYYRGEPTNVFEYNKEASEQ